jgi:hypothetical protein
VTPPPSRRPLRPERLSELLDDAVRHVNVRADALDRIRQGTRRRRAVHRAGVVLLAVAVLAGGGSTALAVTSGRGPINSSAAAAVQQRATSGPTPAETSAYLPAGAGPGVGRALAPSASSPPASSPVDSAADVGQPSAGQAASGDIDGDGRPDTITIVPAGRAKTTSSFLLVVQLTKLGTQKVPFTATSQTDMPPHGPVIIGTADAAHNDHAEIFVQVDSSCCSEFWSIFRLVNGRIRQITIAGYPVAIAVGGSVMNNGGFSCTGPDLVIHFYNEQSGGPTVYRFQAIRDTYRWAGAALVLISRQVTAIRGTPADPALATYSGVTCGGLSAARGEL